MPDATPVPVILDVNLDQEPLKLAQDEIGNQYALSLVKKTFNEYEIWRRNNRDRAWTLHNDLYFGAVPQKVWEGTNIARASVASFIVFTQVENAMPQLMEGLFGQPDWFSVTPEPGADVAQARAIEAHLKYVLSHSQNEFGSAEEELESSLRQCLLHGNGVLMLEWDDVMHRPTVQFVDIKDIYIDPGTNSPSIDASRSIIYRTEMTIDELDNMRADERMSIPSRNQLVYLARNRISAMSDQTKRDQEASRKQNYQPGNHDQLPLPADNRIEVLIYYSKTRIIWVLGREWVAFQDKNQYGFVPFVSAPCFSVPNRFYAQSYGDVLEHTQLYTQALRNARLDAINLQMMPPRTRKRGEASTSSKFKWHPGMIDAVADPKNDVIVHQLSGDPTGSAAQEIEAIGIEGEKITGSNSMSQGVPRPGNANRTKGGVDAQLSASASRLALIGRHIERYMIVPLLYKMYRMIQLNTQEGDTLPALGKDDQLFEVGQEAFKAPVKFQMNGPSKMMTQARLSQIVPFIMQYLGNPSMIQPLNALGQTVDFIEITKMIQDATGVNKYYNLIRPLNPQEQQALQQPTPQMQADQQKQEADAKLRMQLAQEKSQTDIQTTQMETQAKLAETDEASSRHVMKLIADQQMAQQAANPDPMQAIIEAQQAKQKLQQQDSLHKQKLTHQDQLHQQKLHQGSQSAIHGALSGMVDLGMQAKKHQQDLGQTQQAHHQTLAHTQDQHTQALSQEAAMNKKKMEMLSFGAKTKKPPTK